MKPTMNDLKQAILDVLTDASLSLDGEIQYMEIKKDLLKILQAEYNIYFVEPEDEQLEVI